MDFRMKLNQLIAIVSGQKSKTQRQISDLYKKIQNSDLMLGITRIYRPKDEEGEQFPSETKRVQFTAKQALKESEKIYSEVWDLIYSQDVANCTANADVKVNEEVILKAIPVTSLMYLEKQLTDLSTFVEKIPVLDTTEGWILDPDLGYYSAGPIETVKTKKVPKNHIKYEATKDHPAQVEVFHEDIIIGRWETVKFNAGLAPVEKEKILKKIDLLRNAVKMAREEANMLDVSIKNISKRVFEWVQS
jgi:hypothetical protein